MSASTSAPQTFSQSSRKGRKAWRKNIDLTEVQEGIDDVREQIIAGGIVSDKPSEELFTIETTGDAQIQRSYNKRHKPLKADEILAQRSAVPALEFEGGRKRSAPSKVTDGIIPFKRKRGGQYVTGEELDRLRSVAYGGEAVKKDVFDTDATPAFDPWAEVPKEHDPNDFLEEKHLPRPILEPKTTKRAPISALHGGKMAPAVRKPEAGRSYNPNFEDWEALVTREGNKLVEEEKKRLARAREEEERLARAMEVAKAVEAAEKHAEEWGSEWESEWEGIQSEVDNEKIKAKRPERKTKAQRNKIEKRKEMERRERLEKLKRQKEKQAAQVLELKRLVDRKEKERSRALEAQSKNKNVDSSDEAEEEAVRKRRFAKAQIPQAPLEVVLADELQDSLRKLKPEGNLLTDRYRSMLVRGKVEARKRFVAKQPKRTYNEKWSYKDWRLPS